LLQKKQNHRIEKLLYRFGDIGRKFAAVKIFRRFVIFCVRLDKLIFLPDSCTLKEKDVI
jgi:hypothetical protein